MVPVCHYDMKYLSVKMLLKYFSIMMTLNVSCGDLVYLSYTWAHLSLSPFLFPITNESPSPMASLPKYPLTCPLLSVHTASVRAMALDSLTPELLLVNPFSSLHQTDHSNTDG